MIDWGSIRGFNTSTNADQLNRFSGRQSVMGGKISGQELRNQLRAASSAMAEALRSFSNESKPVYRSSIMKISSRVATVSGIGARLTPVVETYSALRTTLRINTQTSTVRKSSSGLGLDITSAERTSRLHSDALGLDLTSPDAPSKLYSALLGLDTTSAERVSALSSSARLGLNLTPAQSKIESTAEMNTATTSFGSSTLSFTGSGLASTSQGTLTGTYTGVGTAANATSLSFRITSGGNPNGLIPVNNLRFEVRDQANTLLFSFNGSMKAGDQIYLGDDIGLSVSFSAGTLTTNHTGSTTVSHAPVEVDPAATFNNSNPSLRPKFDNGAQVAAGSFKVNGTTIAVEANDTINAVIARINASAAGVTATLVNDKIRLTTNDYSESDITLSNDTSGFLSATKLAGAATERGNFRDDEQVLENTSQFGSVASGSFTINGVSISVNKNTDTLASIMSRINSSAAGVTVSYDQAQDKLIAVTNSKSEDLITVSGDTSGFLTAAKLSTGNTVRGNIRDDRQVLSKTTQFAGVSSGSFTINGSSITIDVSTDTLETLIAKISDSAAGVTASYDPSLDKLVLTGDNNSEDLIAVADDTTGFLGAAGLATNNTARGHLSEDTVAFYNLSRFSSVTSGAFVVDGKTIDVTSSDTIQSIVSKINGSGARATAAFDATTNKLSLTTLDNTEDNVSVGSDTSGFLSAAGISATNTLRGNIRDDRQVLSKTSQFAAVGNGSFRINGSTIAVDGGQDTLQTMIDKINTSGAAVTASYDDATDKLIITPDVAGAALAIDSDTSGFLAAVKISTGVAGTRVNADAAFNASGLDSPLFDPGVTVVAGSFTVNGATIQVAANDSVNSVLAKITTSDAGVKATYDDATQTVKLISKDPNTDPITLGDDSSGFLNAVKLNGSVDTSAPTESWSAFDATLSKMTEYASVQAGTLTINAHSFAIDPEVTTIGGLADAINNTAGLRARVDENSGRLTISSRANGRDVTIADDSGLLSKLRIKSGTYHGSAGVNRVVETKTGTVEVSNADTVAANVSILAERLNSVLSQMGPAADEAGIAAAIESLSQAGLNGLTVTRQGGRLRISADREQIESALSQIGSTLAGPLERFAERMAAIGERPTSSFVPAAQNIFAKMLFPQVSRNAALDAYSRARI